MWPDTVNAPKVAVKSKSLDNERFIIEGRLANDERTQSVDGDGLTMEWLDKESNDDTKCFLRLAKPCSMREPKSNERSHSLPSTMGMFTQREKFVRKYFPYFL